MLNSKIKAAIVLILIFTLNSNFWFSELFHNLGFPYLRFQKVIFFFLPGVYIIGSAIKNNRLIGSNVVVVFLFFLFNFILEKYVHYESYNSSYSFDLLERWVYIYLTFIILINSGIKYGIFILNTTITLVLCNLTLIYLDYFGIVNVAEIAKGSSGFEGRLSSKFNLNLVNDLSVFSVYCIFWLKSIGAPYSVFKRHIPNVIFLAYSLGLIMLQASRGSFLLLVVGAILYSIYIWRSMNYSNKILMLLGIIVSTFFIQNILGDVINEITVVNRLQETSIKVDGEEEGRLTQILATMENFNNHPFIGVGYSNAASGSKHGISRSNFQYSQILASGGIFFFITYFIMVFKLFCHSIQLFKVDYIVKSIFIFVLTLFIFRRPESFFAIMAFMLYYRRVQLIKKKSA